MCEFVNMLPNLKILGLLPSHPNNLAKSRYKHNMIGKKTFQHGLLYLFLASYWTFI